MDAFFQMLDLHEIGLSAEDRQKLKKLCETRSNQIKYKDALALITINRNLGEDGNPIRQSEGRWILQIPQKRDRSRSPQFNGTEDIKSMIS